MIRATEGGTALLQQSWGLAPSRPGGRAVINMRTEGRAFARAAAWQPATYHYEFTGTRSPKTRWRFTRAGQGWFWFAGLIGRGSGDAEAFALPTADGGPDVTPYDDRQPVVLESGAWAGWLVGSASAPALLLPSGAGTFDIVEAPRTASSD